jgi:hypothetical protein
LTYFFNCNIGIRKIFRGEYELAGLDDPDVFAARAPEILQLNDVAESI